MQQPPGADVDAIVDDLADNGVSAPGDQNELAAVVDSAEAEHDLALSVVVVDDVSSFDQVRSLTDALYAERGGTVLVLSPQYAAAESETYGAAAGTVAEGLPPGDVAATQQFVDELTDTGPPWVAILLAGAVVLALVAGGGRWWELRRRRRRDAAALAAEGDRLRAEVAEMADEMLAIEPRAALVADEDLGAEYSKVAVEYRDVGHAVERDPKDRRTADELGTRVRALHDRVYALDTATQP